MIRPPIAWFAVAALALAALLWQQRGSDPIGRLLRPEPPPRPFEFDNGSVRRQGVPASRPDGVRARAPTPPGALRKCTRGTETAYTDRDCPPGFREGGLSRGTVNVIGGGGTPPPQPTPRPAGRSSLYDVLDPGADPRLRERTMERALE